MDADLGYFDGCVRVCVLADVTVCCLRADVCVCVSVHINRQLETSPTSVHEGVVIPTLPQHSLLAVLNGVLAFVCKGKGADAAALPVEAKEALMTRTRLLLDRALQSGVPVDVTSFNALLHIFANTHALGRSKSQPKGECRAEQNAVNSRVDYSCVVTAFVHSAYA